MKTNTSNPIRSIVKKLNPFIAATFVVALLAGCDNKGGASAEGPQPKKLRLAFIPNTANEYWSIVHVGCDFAAKNLGNVELEFRFPTRMTAEAQKEVISALLERGVDGIAISPIDADQQAEFLNTVASKTLLICADSDAENSKRVCYIGTDNVAAGKEAGELLKAALPQGGKVALFIGYPNAQNTKDRVQGIQSALAGSGVQIVETIADDHKSPEAQKNATDMLAKHGDLAGMIGIYSYHGPALVTAARSA
ncbi:MAG TPA: substrate-binding domain-containing protein, partial [Verrucomicrobiota bacterium]|nr:substrate-binding domain-containing protein [Verrucomicrobiota bacterium]